MNDYPKMLFKCERKFSDSASVAQALSTKEIEQVIVADEAAEIEKIDDGFGPLSALMVVPAPKVVKAPSAVRPTA
jgi:hypothetical protein